MFRFVPCTARRGAPEDCSSSGITVRMKRHSSWGIAINDFSWQSLKYERMLPLFFAVQMQMRRTPALAAGPYAFLPCTCINRKE